MLHIKKQTQHSTCSLLSHSHCWGLFHICDWAHRGSACDHPAKTHRGKKVASVQCLCLCVHVLYACVCSICKKPVTFTAHCVLTFHFKMTTSQSRATTMAEKEEDRRKKKRKGRIKDRGKETGGKCAINWEKGIVKWSEEGREGEKEKVRERQKKEIRRENLQFLRSQV